MPVIEEMQSSDVLLSHIRSIIKLEDQKAKELLDIYKRVRQELRDRLDLLASDRFEAQQVRGVLAQVEQGVILLEAQLKDQITIASLEAAGNATQDTIREIQTFEKKFRGAITEIPIDQALVAESTRGLKLKQYESSIRRYGADLIDRVNRFLVDSTIQKKPYSKIVQQLAGPTGLIAGEAYRVERIVRTELHSIYDLTRFETLRKTQEEVLPDLQKVSLDPIDDRTGLDSVAVNGQIKDLDQPFRFKGRVVHPVTGEEDFIEVKPFMHHPNRPNDRGVTVPYRKGWENQ